MFEIVLEDGSGLLVSPEHKVYGAVVNPTSSSSFNSEVDTTGTLFSTISQFLGLRCGDGVVNTTYGVDDFNGTDASLSSEFQQFHFLTDFENLEKEVLR